jgi:hypothetical protein
MSIMTSIWSALWGWIPSVAPVDSYDPDACIRHLRNRAESIANRVAAAESLGCDVARLGPHRAGAIEALCQVIEDTSDDMIVREEAAGALGFLWSQIGTDVARLSGFPDDIRPEVEASLASEARH